MIDLPEHKKIVLFDGVCNLCNHSIQQIIKRDHRDLFRFASLQSEYAQDLADQFALPVDELKSIVLVESDGKFATESTAVLRIAKDLKGVSFLSIFLKVPKKWRDAVYRFIARNRYKWFGKKDHCMIPTPQLKAKFLD